MPPKNFRREEQKSLNYLCYNPIWRDGMNKQGKRMMMKISKNKLQEIINEEIINVLIEVDLPNPVQDAAMEVGTRIASQAAAQAGLGRLASQIIIRGLAGGVGAVLFPSDLADGTLAGAIKRIPRELAKAIKKYFPEADIDSIVPKIMAFNMLKHKDARMMGQMPSKREMHKIAGMDAKQLISDVEKLVASQQNINNMEKTKI